MIWRLHKDSITSFFRFDISYYYIKIGRMSVTTGDRGKWRAARDWLSASVLPAAGAMQAGLAAGGGATVVPF